MPSTVQVPAVAAAAASSITDAVIQSLDECQRSFAAHRKCIMRLKKVQATNVQEFRDVLMGAVDRALLVFKREACVERLFQFVSDFITFSNEAYAADSELAVEFIRHLVPLSRAKDKAVRFRSCQLISADAEVDDDFWDEILKYLLPRMNDKIPVVRKHAISAVSRLQDPTDASDSVTADYIRLLGNDSSKEVRKAVLANIGVTAVTLPHIIKRIRDTREDVRKYAFNAIAIKVDVKKLQIVQRVQLVEQGLQDRSESVKKACSDMICKFWLSKCEDNPIQLLRLLDVEIHTQVAERVLKAMLSGNAIKKPGSFLPDDKSSLSSEQVLYWRVLVEFAASSNNDELMEEVLPETLFFCEMFRSNASRCFLASQLLKLTLHLDFGEEIGRRQLHGMVTSLLLNTSTPEDLVPELIASVHAMESSTADFVAYINELLDRLADPEEGGEEAAHEMGQRRGLAVCREMMRTFTTLGQIGSLSPRLKSMVEAGMQNESWELRLLALQCLGLFCLLDEVIAESYLPLLRNVLDLDLESLSAASLSAMMDLLLVHRDSAPWNSPPESFAAADASLLFQSGFRCLAHPAAPVRAVAAEGMAKLLTAGRMRSAPVAEEEALLGLALTSFAEDVEGAEEASGEEAQQCLAVFFAGYATRHTSHAAALSRILVPAMRHVLHAPAGSRLANVNAAHLGQYLLSQLEPPEGAAAAAAAAADAGYARAATDLLLELEAAGGDIAGGRHLVKALHAIPLAAIASPYSSGSGGQVSASGAVAALAERVLAAATDAQIRTGLSKFMQALDEAASAPGAAAAKSAAAPGPRSAEEQETLVRRAVHGCVAALFLPAGAVASTPTRARKSGAPPSAAAKKKRKEGAKGRSAAASPPPARGEGQGEGVRRSTRVTRSTRADATSKAQREADIDRLIEQGHDTEGDGDSDA